MADILTPAELKRITGKDTPAEQYAELRLIGCNPIFSGGKVRIYREAIYRAMVLSESKTKKPELNV